MRERAVRVAVLGAGVSGLTTALLLAEDGRFDVTVVAAHFFRTTSRVAAAIWYPYSIAPAEKAWEWSYASYRRFTELAAAPASGVFFTRFKVLNCSAVRTPPAWALRPEYEARGLSEAECRPASGGFVLRVPVTDSRRYLRWLRAHLGRRVRWEQRDVETLTALRGHVRDVAGLEAVHSAQWADRAARARTRDSLSVHCPLSTVH